MTAPLNYVLITPGDIPTVPAGSIGWRLRPPE